MKQDCKQLIAAENHAGRLPYNASGGEAEILGTLLSRKAPCDFLQPNVELKPILVLESLRKLAADVAQTKNALATIKYSAGDVKLKLAPLAQRMKVAIDDVTFAAQMPTNFCFQPDAQVMIDAIRLHWMGRAPTSALTTFAYASAADPVMAGQVLNAIALEVRSVLNSASAIKRRIFHEMKAVQRTRDVREAMAPVISLVKGDLHVLQADLSILPDVYGTTFPPDHEATQLKRSGQGLLQQIRVQFGAAALATFWDHAYLPGGQSLHLALFLSGPGLYELDCIRQELTRLWGRCTVGRGAMMHNSVPGSPYHYRGVTPEQGMVLTPKKNLARVAEFIGFRDYFLADSIFGGHSDRFAIDLAPKTKRKTVSPKSDTVFEMAETSA